MRTCESKSSLAYFRDGHNTLFGAICKKLPIRLATLCHTACIRIAGIAGRDGEHAGTSRGNFALGGGGGRRSEGGSSCTGEDEDDDESADDVLHGVSPWGASKIFRWTHAMK